MKKLGKKIILYIMFVLGSFMLVYFGSVGIANIFENRFENQIKTSIANKNILKKCSANEETYKSLKDLHHLKVKLNTGDQGSGKIIYFPVQINRHFYDVEFQSKYNSWNQYYGPMSLKEIKRE